MGSGKAPCVAVGKSLSLLAPVVGSGSVEVTLPQVSFSPFLFA